MNHLLLLGPFCNQDRLLTFRTQFEQVKTQNIRDVISEMIKLIDFDKTKSTRLDNERRVFINDILTIGYTHIYESNIVDLQILASAFLFKCYSGNIRSTIIKNFTDLLNSDDTLIQTKLNISDCIINNCNDEKLRELARKIINDNRRVRRVPIDRYEGPANDGPHIIIETPIIQTALRDIAEDTQNVHNSVVSQIIRDQLVILEQDIIPDTPFDVFMKEVTDELSTFSYEKQLFKISSDPTPFFPTKLRLINVFQRIWYRIMNSPNKADLIERLKEELVEMNGMCVSGHCSRLLNVLNGFPDVELTVNDYTDELFLYIKHILQEQIVLEPLEYADTLLESMIDDKQEYTKYIDSKKDYFLSMCRQRYKDDQQLLVTYEKVVKRLLN